MTGPGQGPAPETAGVPAPGAAAGGPADEGQVADLAPGEQFAGPEGHVCLSCGCRIAQGVREVRVPYRGRRGARYRHAGSHGCADPLRALQPNNSFIGRYEALSTFHWDPGPGRPEAQGTAG